MRNSEFNANRDLAATARTPKATARTAREPQGIPAWMFAIGWGIVALVAIVAVAAP